MAKRGEPAMKIIQELCNGCAKCVPECWKAAITKSQDDDKYTIDTTKCDNCQTFFEVECVRVCTPKAIVNDDDSVIEFDPTFRILAGHLQWLVAIMGSRNTNRFPVGNIEYDKFRRLIATAYLNPELKVRVTPNFDDICVGCERKAEPGHAESLVEPCLASFARLGIEPGTIMNFWDLIQLIEDTYSLPFILSQWTDKYKDLAPHFCKYIAHDAKFFTND